MTFNIYVPSYKRADKILTQNLLEYCTYVVRQSEEDKYREAGVKSILAVADEQIDGLTKVKNWIIENTEEDVVCIIDDDIEGFVYRTESTEKVDAVTATAELERLAQLMVDLDIGFGATPIDVNPKFYNCEFAFSGTIGPVNFVNRAKCKARFSGIPFFDADDFVLQELLLNRVILLPKYFTQNIIVDTNAGGTNVNKTLAQKESANLEMGLKWGKYWKTRTGGNVGSVGKVSVRR